MCVCVRMYVCMCVCLWKIATFPDFSLQSMFFGERWRAPDMAWGPWKDEGKTRETAKQTRGGTMSKPPAQPPPRAPGKGTLSSAPMGPPPQSPPPRAV